LDANKLSVSTVKINNPFNITGVIYKPPHPGNTGVQLLAVCDECNSATVSMNFTSNVVSQSPQLIAPSYSSWIEMSFNVEQPHRPLLKDVYQIPEPYLIQVVP
jgi:hypothetical protein